MRDISKLVWDAENDAGRASAASIRAVAEQVEVATRESIAAYLQAEADKFAEAAREEDRRGFGDGAPKHDRLNAKASILRTVAVNVLRGIYQEVVIR